jgi:hypothetical protein
MSVEPSTRGRAIKWTIENGKAILTATLDGKDIQIEIADDIVKQLIVDSPPTEEKKIRGLIDKIHEVRKNRILEMEEIDKADVSISKENDDAITALKTATGKNDVAKWTAIIKALGNKKQLLTERRHLIRLSYQQEGELSLQLRQLQSGQG